MNLAKLFSAQKVLRDRINYNEPDRFNKLVLALLVELGECANEWRGFKFWSKDQEPRIKGAWKKSTGIENGKFIDVYENPLLEEYVDGLHFVLELGIEFGLETITPYLVQKYTALEMFTKVYQRLVRFQTINGRTGKEFYYGELVSNYLMLGYVLGFTWEQIEQAYMEKNKVNHQRQSEGY